MNNAIFREKRNTPFDSVFDSCARTFSGAPEFKVFFSVVVAYGVLMVNAFSGLKRTAKKFFHDFAMLRNHYFFTFITASKNPVTGVMNGPAFKLSFVLALYRAVLFSFIKSHILAFPVEAPPPHSFMAELALKGRSFFGVPLIVTKLGAEFSSAAKSLLVGLKFAFDDTEFFTAAQARDGYTIRTFIYRHCGLLFKAGYHVMPILSIGR